MKKIIITESQLKNITQNLVSEAQTPPVEVRVAYRFNASYAVGQSDPTVFIADFTKGLLEKINSVPNGKQMLASGTMTFYAGTIIAGSSNVWLGKPTPFNATNAYKGVEPSDPKNDLYTKNVNLSLARAQGFRTALFNSLKTQKVSDNDKANVTYKTMVVDTGGVKDEQRDTSKYPNPGQYIQVSLVFRYAKDIGIETIIGSTGMIKTYTDIKPNFVLTGSYYCNGKNSEGKSSGSPEMKKAMAEMCAGVGGVKEENGKYAMAFEIKWNTNVLKDPYTTPILRWMFHFNEKGKIDKVIRYVYNKEYIFLRDSVPQSEVPVGDKEMKFYMGIRQNQPETGGTFYQKFIQPYI